VQKYLKAIAAALIAGLGALQVALDPTGGAPSQVTAREWAGVGISTLVALSVVWAVPNEPA